MLPILFGIRSYVFNTAAMTAMTFASGGMAMWVPSYISEYRAAEFPPSDALLAKVNYHLWRNRRRGRDCSRRCSAAGRETNCARVSASAYFLVSGAGMFLAFPATLGVLCIPFPWAWGCLFVAIFFLFFNTGPANTALANVTPPQIRATAFACNILIIHLLGDAISPPLMGWIAGRWSMNTAFLLVSGMMVLASAFWFFGARYLERDTAAINIAPAGG